MRIRYALGIAVAAALTACVAEGVPLKLMVEPVREAVRPVGSPVGVPTIALGDVPPVIGMVPLKPG